MAGALTDEELEILAAGVPDDHDWDIAYGRAIERLILRRVHDKFLSLCMGAGGDVPDLAAWLEEQMR